jgi:FkbM family methyltransferase
MDYPRLPLLFRPYIAREMPGWGKLFPLLGIDGIHNVNPRWRKAPKRTIRGKMHGYRMELDLSDNVERATYFLGRYVDLASQLVLDTLLKPGDTFIDVGANIGMMTLLAASRVGDQGRVLSFEPQPLCCERIRQSLADNGIRHVQIHNVGLADRADELTLRVHVGGRIMASFSIPEGDPSVGEEIRIPVVRGDDLVRGQVVGDLLIKIDVEGYELHVLRGLEATIEGHRPPIMTEVIPYLLRRSGVDEHQLFSYLRERGYRPFAISEEYRRPRLRRPRLGLRPFERSEELAGTVDVLWLQDCSRNPRCGGGNWSRLRDQ